MTTTYVYAFEDGNGHDKKLLGGKGANLCEMTQIGLNVPPGFVISTVACLEYLDGGQLPDGLLAQVRQHIANLEQRTGKQFGDASNPLLLSVRSGSALSMPGMMDTILNLGLNAETLPGLIAQTDNERFGYDAYRRFVQLFSKIALGVPDELFDAEFAAVKRAAGVTADVELSARHLREASERFLNIVEKHTGQAFPNDVYAQLEISIQAVFKSWNGKRAIDYRREFQITPEMANGTAVNIVTMVFGNLGDDSATGVGFTRNPATGANEMYGEYLINAQGEDVVAGIRTPKPVSELADEMPELYRQLVELRDRLESHYHEVQDYEYTIEKGVLYCLQTRNGKMNAAARVRTSVEMCNEGLISRKAALLRVNPAELEQLLHPRLDPAHTATALAKGLPASPGAACGVCVFDADRAVQVADQGTPVILVREETKPEDIHGFFAAKGILTSRGGKTSHAAVVARGMGKPCVAGAEGIQVDSRARIARIGNITLHEGDTITIDGSDGHVYLGAIASLPAVYSDELKTLLNWADEVAHLKVRANADTAESAKVALEHGAQGIGLCRTERMFNAADRLPVVVDLILANSTEERQTALDKLLPMQRDDFKAILKITTPRPVTVRLLDPPMHEFLPGEIQLIEDIAELQAQPRSPEILAERQRKERILGKVRQLREVNPMLGHRGVRLGLSYPEIYRMQIRAILEASADCQRDGVVVNPEIMIPQVICDQELQQVRTWFEQILADVERQFAVKLVVKFGSMVETVRACLCAKDLAGAAEFFSFGTNDLTQATFSFSREDAENKFLPQYIKQGLLRENPFEVLDIASVGKLMEMAVAAGRSVKTDLKVGICGEHGGHPDAVNFCHAIGLNYVSCSPHRVPLARLAAAQAELRDGSAPA